MSGEAIYRKPGARPQNTFTGCLGGPLPSWTVPLTVMWLGTLPALALWPKDDDHLELPFYLLLAAFSLASLGPALVMDWARSRVRLTKLGGWQLVGLGEEIAVSREEDCAGRIQVQAPEGRLSLHALARQGTSSRGRLSPLDLSNGVTEAILVGGFAALVCGLVSKAAGPLVDLPLGALTILFWSAKPTVAFVGSALTWILWQSIVSVLRTQSIERVAKQANGRRHARVYLDETTPFKVLGPNALLEAANRRFNAILGLDVLFALAPWMLGYQIPSEWVGHGTLSLLGWLYLASRWFLFLALPWVVWLDSLANTLRWGRVLRLGLGPPSLHVDGEWRSILSYEAVGTRIRFDADGMVVWCAPPGYAASASDPRATALVEKLVRALDVATGRAETSHVTHEGGTP